MSVQPAHTGPQRKPALQWRPTSWKPVYLSIGLTVFSITALFVLVYLTNQKTIYLEVNGNTVETYTQQSTVGDLLREQNISVHTYDYVSHPLNHKLKHGESIKVKFTSSITVQVDGEKKQLYSTKPTVFGALAENGIALGIFDRISPSLSTPLSDGLEIEVTRVIKEWREITEKLDYNVVRKADATLLKGKEQVVQEGKSGSLIKVEQRIYENGVLVSAEMVDSEEVLTPQPKVIAYGTKKEVVLTAASPVIQTVTKDGVTFDVRKVIPSAELTAYGAGEEHTGKTKDHPHYGITFTGVRAEEGRTVAVDPKVIPLRWWIYIEGFGFRRTEDTGSAVKGNRIDIYFEDDDYATAFGLKRGYKVYIIGPDKPF